MYENASPNKFCVRQKHWCRYFCLSPWKLRFLHRPSCAHLYKCKMFPDAYKHPAVCFIWKFAEVFSSNCLNIWNGFYSFACIEKGVPIHVPKVTYRSRLHCWNPQLEMDVSTQFLKICILSKSGIYYVFYKFTSTVGF